VVHSPSPRVGPDPQKLEHGLHFLKLGREAQGIHAFENDGAVLGLELQAEAQTMRRRIAELEVKLARTEDLVRVLKDLPWSRTSPSKKEATDGRRNKKRSSKKRRSGPPASRKAATTNRGSDVAGRDEAG